jgi:hypothetical protein
MRKLEHIIGEYFKIINHLPYESIDIIKKDPVTIIIYVKVKDGFTLADYYDGDLVVMKLADDMKNMFPFTFYVL